MRKLLTGFVVGLLALGIIAAAALVSLYRASQQVPEFYQRALVQAAADRDCSERFERQALALHNQARRAGEWKARFTEEEINAWLAAVLPEKFPQLVTSGISEPRVAIEEDVIRLAVRYERGSTRTIVSLAARPRLTDETNEVAVELREVKAGSLPLPLAGFLDEIKAHAAQAGVPLRWTEVAGQPVALFRLPLGNKKSSDRQIQVERLELQDGALLVGGRTTDTEGKPAEPIQSVAGSDDQPGEELASPASNETRQR